MIMGDHKPFMFCRSTIASSHMSGMFGLRTLLTPESHQFPGCGGGLLRSQDNPATGVHAQRQTPSRMGAYLLSRHTALELLAIWRHPIPQRSQA